MSSDKIKLVRFSNVVPFGPGPGVREVQGCQPGVSLAVEPGLLVMCKVVKDATGNTVHTTKVPLAHCTCIVYEPKREQLVSTSTASAVQDAPGGRPTLQELASQQAAQREDRARERQAQAQPEPEESAEPTSEIVLEGAEKPAPAPTAPAPEAKPASAKKAKAKK